MNTELSTYTDESHLLNWIQQGRFDCHYQPVVDLKLMRVIGHEVLMRPHADSGYASPLEVFALARTLGLDAELDLACVRKALLDFATRETGSRLFLNINSATLARTDTCAELIQQLKRAERFFGRNRLVVELTEYDSLNHAAVPEFLDACRRTGARIALDDFGVGHSNLDAWLEYAPDKIKIDRYFVQGVDSDTARQQMLRGLRQMADAIGTRLLAEGIETAAELQTVRELGVDLVQGYFLGRPHPSPVFDIRADARQAAGNPKLVVLPPVERRRPSNGMLRPHIQQAPTSHTELTNREALAMFSRQSNASTIVLCDEESRPVAVLTRTVFMDKMALPYRIDVLGNKSAMSFANCSPVVLDQDADIAELANVLTLTDQRYLTDGVVVTQGGKYLGVCAAHSLIRLVTETRIEAARHANPLTHLPGNFPITQHLERMLDSAQPFTVAYADLNHFKPFNDRYGFWRGDDIILQTAACIREQIDPLHDFLGHVGGDDFVLVMQSADWLERLQTMTRLANEAIAAMYPHEDRVAGGIHAEDRFGVRRFFPLVTLSFGAVQVLGNCDLSLADLTASVADAKKQSKESGTAIIVQRSPCKPPGSTLPEAVDITVASANVCAQARTAD